MRGSPAAAFLWGGREEGWFGSEMEREGTQYDRVRFICGERAVKWGEFPQTTRKCTIPDFSVYGDKLSLKRRFGWLLNAADFHI